MTYEDNLSACAFCDIFETGNGKITGGFLEAYPMMSEAKQVIEIHDNFFLIPDIAPLTTDHLLLITKSHVPSFANISKQNKEELQVIASKIIKKMKDMHPLSEIVIFEHGVGTIDGQTVRCGSCGRTDHAHLHILPVPEQETTISTMLVKEISQTYDLRPQEILPLPNFDIRSYVKDFPYLYLWSDKDSHAHVLVQDSTLIKVPSQLIRRLLATEFLGVDEKLRWDWRDFIIFYPADGQQMLEYTLSRWQ